MLETELNQKVTVKNNFIIIPIAPQDIPVKPQEIKVQK